ncbi:MAG TPA: hypothetical protein VMV98_08620 [Acidobacteriaceae bacterium]|nr:hypothetical protein [Acidobacteriaceae bacterium]
MFMTFSLELKVDDESALRRAAAERAGSDGLEPEQANEFLDPDTKSVEDCVVMLLDPGQSPAGTSILDSSAKESNDLVV